MKRLLIIATMFATTAAHASWSDPTASQYDDSGATNGIVAAIVIGFAIYGFYKFATRKG